MNLVQYKSFGIPSLNKAYFQRAMHDENVQYLLLALYWNIGESEFYEIRPSSDVDFLLAEVRSIFSLFPDEKGLT